MSNIDISIVVPVYKSPGTLEELTNRLISTLELLVDSFEIVLVNDASPDNSWEIISEIALRDERVIGIDLSRNFGQHQAIHAGLTASSGKWIVVMDCDLQDRPEEIPQLYLKAQEGFQQVVGIRRHRQDSGFKKLTSILFFKCLSLLTDERLDHQIGNFGIYERPVIDSVLSMGDSTRTFSILVRWVGFQRTEIEVQHDKREFGKSSYSIRQLASLALQTIIGSSNKPLRLAIGFGFSISAISFLLGVWIGVQRILNDVSVVGWASTMIVISCLMGFVIASIGILGLYVGQIFNQVKGRPKYIVKSVTPSNREK